MKFSALCLLFLAGLGCSSPSRRVTLRLKNSTPHAITLRVSAGLLSRDIPLTPGQTWDGWLDRAFCPEKAAVEIR